MRRACMILALSCSPVFAVDVDSVVTVVNEANATGGKTIGAFAWDPTSDTMYVTSFGATAPFAEAAIRKVQNVSGAQVATGMLSEGQVQLYYRDGNPDRSVTNPTVSGILLNPMQIGTGSTAIGAYQSAVIVDIALTRLPSSTTTDPAATKRFYRWNLQAPPAPSPTPPPYGDGRDVFSTMVTLQHMQTAAGTTSTTSNIGRQFAYSGDGQSIYALDTSPAFGGLYKVDLVTNATTRLAVFSDANTELARTSAAGVDTLYFAGGGTVTNNAGGIDKLTHDGTNTGVRTVHLPAAELNAFLENTGTFVADSRSMAADSAGNLYFNNITNMADKSRGLYRLDTQGRLVKIVGYEERKVIFGPLITGGNPNSNMLRMQFRDTFFDNGSGTFAISQLLYAESSGADTVAGAYLFKTGDFNRDNVVDAADIDLFKNNLTLRGVALAAINPADHPKFRYDLNGNNEVSWKDVKVLQDFYGFYDGDTNIDKTVNISDFAVLAANFNQSGRKWTEGDFDGNEIVNINDFAALAANFNLTFPADVPRGAVPEPAVLAPVIAAGLFVRRRRI